LNKIDLKNTYKHLYQPSKKTFTLVDVPPLQYLMIDGHGDPNNNPQYQEKFTALYSVAYTLKFAMKPQGLDFTVMPPEGLWWTPDMADFSLERKDLWDWTLMTLMPEQITTAGFEEARKQANRKKPLPAMEALRLETLHEGLSVQILYLGAYADEGPTIARMHQFIHQNGYQMDGKHHEIYLGDPRRTAPEKLKTVIRQPVKA